MKKKVVIVNPIAGKGEGESFLKEVTKLKTDKYPNLFVEVTESHGHAEKIALKYNSPDTDLIVAGGDGTLHEVLQQTAPDIKFTLGVVPIGSGNDFARELGVIKNPIQCLDETLQSSKVSTIDIGKISIKEFGTKKRITHYFIGSCGIGFDAYVAYLSNMESRLRGLPLYVTSVIKALYKTNPFEIEGNFDETVYSGLKLLLAIGNSKSSGGGIKLVPKAELNDGLLDCCLVDAANKLTIMSKLPLAIAGKHLGIKEATYTQFRNASLRSKSPVFVHNDGEVISKNAETMELSVIPSVLKVLSI